MTEPKPNTIERDKNVKTQGITARCHICSWVSGGHFSGMSASAAKQDHIENAHGRNTEPN